MAAEGGKSKPAMAAAASLRPPCSSTKPSSPDGLDAKTLPNQLAETKIGSNVLNRMASLGIRVSVRIK